MVVLGLKTQNYGTSFSCGLRMSPLTMEKLQISQLIQKTEDNHQLKWDRFACVLKNLKEFKKKKINSGI